jgi:hypothetical protein
MDACLRIEHLDRVVAERCYPEAPGRSIERKVIDSTFDARE